MSPDEYFSNFEETANDSDINPSEKLLTRLSKRAAEIELNADFTLDDVYEELLELLSTSQKSMESYLDFLQEISNFVFDNKECGDSDEEDLDED